MKVSFPEWSLWCLTVRDPRGEGDVIHGSRNGGVDIFHPSFPYSHASLLPTLNFTHVLQIWNLWLKAFKSLLCSLPQLLRQEVAKTICWGWAGAWKRCQRGSWPWKAQAPLVQQDGFCFSFRIRVPLRLYKRAHCQAVTDSQRPETGCHEGSLPSAIS